MFAKTSRSRDASNPMPLASVARGLPAVRSMKMLPPLVVYRTKEEAEVIYDLLDKLIADAMGQGYFEYRTHTRYMDNIQSKMAFNRSAHK